jgi:hypothetical protein
MLQLAPRTFAVSGWLSKPFEVSGIAELFYAASFPQKEKKK